jgi:two-component system, OmpR family, sensor histidine kinase PrrB
VSAPSSLRARITVAAVLAVALAGAAAGAALVAAVARDGRAAVDRDLRERVARIAPVPGPDGGGFGRFGGRGFGGRGPGRGAERLLVGSGTFAQVSYGGQVVDQGGDVPANAPGVPARDGLQTVRIGATDWRSLTLTLGSDPDGPRLQLLSSLAPLQARIGSLRRLVLMIGLVALALTALAAWAFTTLAVRPLARLRAGAARVSGAEDLATPLPEDEGPVEVRSLARALNDMLARVRASTAATERALHATRRFAADAGHELRTPLTVLRANLDALARNPGLAPAERSALVADMAGEQERIVHLLEGLQALARGDAAESLPREDVEFGDLVDAALEPFARGTAATAPGTGLGLAIVAQQVALHDGDLRLDESELGGLRVQIRLPATEAIAAARR